MRRTGCSPTGAKAGGYGTWMFTVGGCMLLGVAAFIVVRGRKHNRNDQ